MLETDLERCNFARQVPTSHPLSNSLPALPSDSNLRQDTADWGNIVDQQKNEFDAYSTIFRPQSDAVTDPETLAADANVFQDDLTMPSAFNLSQNQYSVAIEEGDPFQQHMAYLQQSMSQVMHENFQLEQRMNNRYLHMQSTAPGSAQDVLQNSRDAMNRFLAAKHRKEAMVRGKMVNSGYNLSDFSQIVKDS